MGFREFTCAACGAPCLTTTTEAEANTEYLNSGMPTTENDSLVSVCDGCYQRPMQALRERRKGENDE